MSAPFVRPLLLAAATLALGACTAYDGFGQTRVSVGYSSGGYYPYGYSRYPYYGWYDGFYYPGIGYYIYDDYGRRYRWSDRYRRYWESRRDRRGDYRENWSGYRRDRDGRYYDGDRRDGDWQRRGDGRRWDRDGRRDDDRRGGWQRGSDSSNGTVSRERRSVEVRRETRSESRSERPTRNSQRARVRGEREVD